MIELVVALYCASFLNVQKEIDFCVNEKLECVRRIDDLKYRESRWLDVPNFKMSMESLGECVNK